LRTVTGKTRRAAVYTLPKAMAALNMPLSLVFDLNLKDDDTGSMGRRGREGRDFEVEKNRHGAAANIELVFTGALQIIQAEARGATPTRCRKMNLTELEAFDRRAPGGKTERRFCCPTCGVDKPTDAQHRSLSVNMRTGLYTCHRCQDSGKLEEEVV
jgi:hypothetical protein